VLVTDGQPGMSVDGVFQPGCDENHMGGVADVARAAANGSPPISTYVIGITDDPISLAGLDVVADAGGTGEAVIIDDVDSEQTRAEFQATLERIRQNNLACYLRIPEPPPGSGDLEFDRVNVDFVSGGGDTVPLDYDPNCASGSGWQYDGDNRDDPSWIQLCPTACGQVRSDSGARMDIQLGCETRSLG